MLFNFLLPGTSGQAAPRRLQIRPILFATVAALAGLFACLQGCDSVNQAVVQAKATATAALAPLSSNPASAGDPNAPVIAGSELDGIFKRYPLGSPQSHDNYPRAAVTIISATPSILKIGPPTADQCVRFNVRLWSNAKTSRSFDGLQMCAKDKSSGVPFRTIQLWQGSYVPGETTGAVRTEGPGRPKTNFPTEARVATAWFDSSLQGIIYVGSILYQLGFDWDQPGEHRLWFVAAPSP